MAQPPALAAGLGALGALVAAPIDAAWHETYGRDSVLFSPPHMLVVLASTSLVLGVLAGLPATARRLRLAAGVLLLANAAVVVFEYEADVPQFSETYYLPLLLLVGVASALVVSVLVPVPLPMTGVVLGYVVLRLTISGALVTLGRSAPDLPIAVLGLAAFDLRLRRTWMRVVAAAVATSALAWAASAASIASPPAADVGVVALPVVLIGLLVLLGSWQRGSIVAAALLGAVAVVTVGSPDPAAAHDPGQGEPVARVQLTGTTDGDGRVDLRVTLEDHCDDSEPRSIDARRAGVTETAALLETEPCVFRGQLALADEGRWFIYSSLVHRGSRVEAWLPLEVGTTGTLQQTRDLYRPAGEGPGVTKTQALSGGLVYAFGVGLLLVGARAASGRGTGGQGLSRAERPRPPAR